MYNLKKGLVILCTISSFFCSAQNTTSPEVFSFKQEVFRPISYYTGQASISIPVTEIKTNEITIPITLNYTGGGGLRTINPYSNVGMGWRLSAGGAITRTKNGVCDETISNGDGILSGFFTLAANTLTNSYVRNNVSSYVGILSKEAGQQFLPTTEYSPDIFSFSFLGYSGFFVRGYDGEFKIQSQDIVLAEKLDAPWPWPGRGNCVGFRLTANDGTKFTFGSTEGSIELSGGNGGIPFQCDAWYLTEIKSTNGEMVHFRYHSNTSTVNFCFYTTSGGSPASSTSPVILDYISFNGGKVVVNSSVINQNICEVPSRPRLINKVQLLDTDNHRVTSTSFTYSSESLQRYYFLDDVVVNGKQYSFKYDRRTSLPSYNNHYGMDFWGYFNGQSGDLIEHSKLVYRDVYLNQDPNFPRKAPSEDYSKLGILTSITYPTGGVELYEYEANTYSHAGVQTLGGNYYRYLDQPQKTGGLRIAKITLGDMVRKYKYVNNFDPRNPNATSIASGFSSSGYLYKLPAVAYNNISEPLNFLSIDGESHIVYSKVIELLSDNSYTEYTMNAPDVKPDGENNQNANFFSVWSSNPDIFNFIPESAFVGSLGKNTSSALERGQVSSIKIYDAANVLKKSTLYKYATDPNRYNENVAGVFYKTTADQNMASLALELTNEFLNGTPRFGLSIIHSYNIYTFPVYLDEVIETSYEGSGTIQQTSRYQYNGQKLKSLSTTTNNTGDELRTSYKYPSDINTVQYASMVTKKMLNFPVEVVQLKNNTITGSRLMTYKPNGTTYVADKNFSLELLYPLTESAFTYFNGTTKDIHYGSQPEITYNMYDTHGNVTQATARNGIVTSYLWDATGTYSMAQVVAANYSQISAQNGKTAGYSSSTLFSALAAIVPKAFVKTYSYKSLVGITSTTDERGRNTFYKYDQFNRLMLIRDHDDNILKKYCYNYQGQSGNCSFFGNQPLSQTNRRNNCTGCGIGSLVTYSVPADAYYDSTQDAANILAQRDIEANAQAYANENSTCNNPVMVSPLFSNASTTLSFTIKFRNNCTGFDYIYTMNANTNNVILSPQLPTGNYTVTFTPPASVASGFFGYWVNGYYQYAHIGTIAEVDIVNGSNTVRITP